MTGLRFPSKSSSRACRRRLPERAVAVTFDDGYADNLEIAAPILAEHGIPATLFVATGLVDADGPPWWDRLASLLLEPARLPSTLALSSGGDPWHIPPLATGERRSSPTSSTLECRAGDAPARLLRGLARAARARSADREATLDEIAEWAGAPRSCGRIVMTWEQVRLFAALPGLALGAHRSPTPPCQAARARTRAPRSPAVPTGYAPKPASRWTSSPTPSAHGPRASRVLSPTSASVLPTRPPGMRSRGAHHRTRSHACRPGHAPGEFARLLVDVACR